MRQLAIVLAVALAAALAPAGPTGALRAQDRAKEIPAEHRPPKGMCRIWLDNVPASQQPAPTDCPTAVRNRPANGRVIFGNDYVDEDKGEKGGAKNDGKGKTPPFVQSFGGRRGSALPVPLVRRPDDKAKRTPPDSL